MTDLVTAVTEYQIKVELTVEAKVAGRMTVTDADVREWAELDGTEDIDPELLEEYVMENLDEGALELIKVTDWSPLRSKTELTILSSARTMRAPESFVPLPGMEGL